MDPSPPAFSGLTSRCTLAAASLSRCMSSTEAGAELTPASLVTDCSRSSHPPPAPVAGGGADGVPPENRAGTFPPALGVNV
jgi:hypothetical protein